jgi:hypothetical protein
MQNMRTPVVRRARDSRIHARVRGLKRYEVTYLAEGSKLREPDIDFGSPSRLREKKN